MNRELGMFNDKSDLVISVAKKNTIEHVFLKIFKIDIPNIRFGASKHAPSTVVTSGRPSGSALSWFQRQSGGLPFPRRKGGAPSGCASSGCGRGLCPRTLLRRRAQRVFCTCSAPQIAQQLRPALDELERRRGRLLGQLPRQHLQRLSFARVPAKASGLWHQGAGTSFELCGPGANEGRRFRGAARPGAGANYTWAPSLPLEANRAVDALVVPATGHCLGLILHLAVADVLQAASRITALALVPGAAESGAVK